MTKIEFEFKTFPKTWKPLHGPQKWSWWKLFAFDYVVPTVCWPSTGHRIWFYSRWGYFHFDVVFDRRDQLKVIENENQHTENT